MTSPHTTTRPRDTGTERDHRHPPLLPGTAPVLLMLIVAVTDLLTPDWLHVLPVMAGVPVLAAALLSCRATATVGAATLAVTALLQADSGRWGRPDGEVTLATLVVAGLASLAACSLRQRRETQLRRVRSVAETAQRALMHPLPSRIGPLELRGVYLPAESEARIGGDFYEALRTPFGPRVLIGDVRGKGLTAVDASATLLGAFRELAYREADLTEVSEQLDERARRQIAALGGTPHQDCAGALFAERFATALLVEFPPGEPVARIVHCGHPEPYVLRGEAVRPHEPDQPGAPLGLGDLLDARPVAETVPFAPGDRLVLYTDGFIEARDRGGRFHDLAAHVRAHAGRPLQTMVTALRRDLLHHVQGDLDDDAALVAIERLPDEEGGPVDGRP
ncbi:PP2C family protein-serine/threonine phosphatase [Streptomyces sp. NPDC047097]|uniref:PP2C family protein-serine/threonine phosphatase n=1 Tax=Streptomyces sp. NPDC047097 TaxID=3155260 RepID=UPI0033E0E5DA